LFYPSDLINFVATEVASYEFASIELRITNQRITSYE